MLFILRTLGRTHRAKTRIRVGVLRNIRAVVIIAESTLVRKECPFNIIIVTNLRKPSESLCAFVGLLLALAYALFKHVGFESWSETGQFANWRVLTIVLFRTFLF